MNQIPEHLEKDFSSFLEKEKKEYSKYFVDLICKNTDPFFLKICKRTRKIPFLMGNGYSTIPIPIREKVFSWQRKYFGFSQEDHFTLINRTKLGKILTQIKTFPSHSSSKSLSEESIISFPLLNYRFFWSPLVTNINLLLKNIIFSKEEKSNWNYPSSREGKRLKEIIDLNKDLIYNIKLGKEEDVFPLLEQLDYKSSDLESALLSGHEIIFSSVGFHCCYASEINSKLFKTLLWNTK